jgi:hypothetical protein
VCMGTKHSILLMKRNRTASIFLPSTPPALLLLCSKLRKLRVYLEETDSRTTDEKIDRQMHEKIDIRTYEQRDKWIKRQVGQKKDRQVDIHIDRQMNRIIERQTGVQKIGTGLESVEFYNFLMHKLLNFEIVKFCMIKNTFFIKFILSNFLSCSALLFSVSRRLWKEYLEGHFQCGHHIAGYP